MLLFTCKEGFTLLLDNTIATVAYHKQPHSDNFIAQIDNNYILYALKQEKHHTSCNTIFKLKPTTLKKYYNDNTFKMLKRGCEADIKRYMN